MLKNIQEIIVRVLKFSIHLLSSIAIELYLELVLFRVGDCEGCREKIKKDLKRECDEIAQMELRIFFIILVYSAISSFINWYFESCKYVEVVLYIVAFSIFVPIILSLKERMKPNETNRLSFTCFPDEINKRINRAPWELMVMGLLFLFLGKIFGVDVKGVILFFINVIALGAVSFEISRRLSSEKS